MFCQENRKKTFRIFDLQRFRWFHLREISSKIHRYFVKMNTRRRTFIVSSNFCSLPSGVFSTTPSSLLSPATPDDLDWSLYPRWSSINYPLYLLISICRTSQLVVETGFCLAHKAFFDRIIFKAFFFFSVKKCKI